MLMDKLRNEAQKERLSQQREREVLNKFQQEVLSTNDIVNLYYIRIPQHVGPFSYLVRRYGSLRFFRTVSYFTINYYNIL